MRWWMFACLVACGGGPNPEPPAEAPPPPVEPPAKPAPPPPRPNRQPIEGLGSTDVQGRVLEASIQGGELILTIGVGTDHGLTRQYVGELYRDDGTRLVGHSLAPIRIDRRETVVKVSATLDDVLLAQRVVFRTLKTKIDL